MWWWIAALALVALVVAALLTDWQVVQRRLRRDAVGEAEMLAERFERADGGAGHLVIRPWQWSLRPSVIVVIARSRGWELERSDDPGAGSPLLAESLTFRPAELSEVGR